MSQQAITTIYTCDNNDNFVSSDDDKLTISQAAFRLILQALAGQTFNEDAADNTDWTYDSAYYEFSGGSILQKDQRPTGASLGHSFVTKNNSWGDNADKTGTLAGTGAIVGSKLECKGGAGSVSILASNTTNPMKGWVYFEYKPEYGAGGPSSDAELMTYRNSGNLNNFTRLYQDTSSVFRMDARSDTGAVGMTAASLGTLALTAGQTYKCLWRWNFTPGSELHRFYVDGTPTSAPLTTAVSRDNDLTSIDKLIIGGVSYTDATFDNVAMFPAADPSAGDISNGVAVSDTIYYDPSGATLPVFSYAGVGVIQALTGFAVTGTGSPRFTVNGKYWSGAAWVAGNSYSAASSASDINTNLGSLDVEGDTTVTVKLFGPNGDTQSGLDDLTVTYTGQIYSTDVLHFDPVDDMGSEEIEAVTADFDLVGSDQVKMIQKVGGSFKYWNGAAVVASDGVSLAQANTYAEVQANKASFVTTNGRLSFRILFASDDGSTSPVFRSITYANNYSARAATDPDTTNVSGTVYDANGAKAAGVVVRATLMKQVSYNAALSVLGSFKEDTSNANGYWDVALVDNDNMPKFHFYRFTFTYTDGTVKTKDRHVPHKDDLAQYDPDEAPDGIRFEKLPEVEI